MKKQISGIYTIIDPQEINDIVNLCSRIAKTELNIIQYRDKENDFETMLNIASKLKNICDKYNKIFIINDYPKLAKKINFVAISAWLKGKAENSEKKSDKRKQSTVK